MKKLIYLIPFLLFWSCSEPKTEEITEETLTETPPTTIEEAMPDSVLRHVVLFGFKETTSPEDVQKVIDAFKALPSQISEIKGFEWGTNSSPEGLNQGLTHAFTLTFHSDSDRDAYLPHPAHKAFGNVIGSSLDKVTVVDYWTKP
ncbi:Dabb family protein [Algoriphagus sp. A40]|uniref:Dabb family protein n=1 Tax=Algoriphagus sp. A40 TaxID=1945863 RepID=UPI00098490A3|nr:Dabb family protein [Algoriphagus sp. A40]OOG76399.1 stress protein [Algoriphagus sp. A40]